jgi:predicted KAP-like P-loop ATPase
MTFPITNPNATPIASGGCDNPVVSRSGDHLNRWPLAREIYGIAITGSKDWSVRVGIYGEWGTGKTSLLKLIASMAEPTGHIVIWFDPWEYSNKPELWRSFVLTVFKELESKLGQVPGADEARRKVWMDKAKGIVGTVTGVLNESAGKAVDAGLELVRKHFNFSQDDLKSLQSILGEKRVIVLIDDLDRTAPELVPEILFALKELINIPGFSFVCAFDPVVVGEVLGKYHPGFRDGHKFLDKIIDYPR